MKTAKSYEIDPSQIDGYAQALREAPGVLVRELAIAYQAIVKYDISTLKQKLPGKLNIRAKGLANSFKGKATDPKRATGFEKLFGDEYTGWDAASIFQTGGAINAKSYRQMTVLFGGEKTATGRRKITRKQLRDLILAGKVIFVPTPHGVLIVQNIGGLTKSGKTKKGTRTVILGMLKKVVNETKRLDFYENSEANDGVHQEMLDYAVENTLAAIATGKTK